MQVLSETYSNDEEHLSSPPQVYEHHLPQGYEVINQHKNKGNVLFKGTNNLYDDLKAFNKLIEEAKKHQSVINNRYKIAIGHCQRHIAI